MQVRGDDPRHHPLHRRHAMLYLLISLQLADIATTHYAPDRIDALVTVAGGAAMLGWLLMD